MDQSADQLELFKRSVIEDLQKLSLREKRSGTFLDNMKLPIHRWYRYSAGFSAEWAQKIISEFCANKDSMVFDPYAGSGTVILAADAEKVNSLGLEAQKFVFQIAKAKLSYNTNPQLFYDDFLSFINHAQKSINTKVELPNSLLVKCFTSEALLRLEAIRKSFFEFPFRNEKVKNLIWLAITAILRECSYVGTAPWQYVLPKRTKAKTLDPFLALHEKGKIIFEDLLFQKIHKIKNLGSIKLGDSRAESIDILKSYHNKVSLVITSPPYPNNYDYADATRLEMTFWKVVENWGDLHEKIRKFLIRSCSQHTAKERNELDDLLSDPSLKPIKKEIATVCQELSEIRQTKGGKKTYHTMVAAYFSDMASSWQLLRKLCKKNATCCFVIGDSAPYGVHVPVEKWLGELALSQGFKNYKFEKWRDRNIKWKNRKHRIPLKEGLLWVKG